MVSHAFMLTPLALQRISGRGLEVRTILDIGASNGRWSLEARKYWPDARCHLIEANPYHRDSLEMTIRQNPYFSYVLAAAGASVGTISFDASDPFGGVADEKYRDGSRWIEVPVTTIDDEVAGNILPKPFLVKLDTHGFEVPILNGAKETLKNTNLLVIETYNFDVGSEGLKFYEMCAFVDQLGFLVIDISEPLWRLKDRAFWQMDLLFVRKDRPEFEYGSYR